MIKIEPGNVYELELSSGTKVIFLPQGKETHISPSQAIYVDPITRTGITFNMTFEPATITYWHLDLGASPSFSRVKNIHLLT